MAGVKDAAVYSTLEGAKKRAKELNNRLEACGLIYPLAKCQAAVAKAGGYQDWHDLTNRIGNCSQHLLPFDYWGSLIAELPEPCHLPIKSLFSKDALSGNDSGSVSEDWARNVIPYLCSLEIAHRKNTPLLRPGSGRDQKLRLEIVGGLLLCGPRSFPKLDPESLTVSIDQEPKSILPKTAAHPRFSDALKALAAARIIFVQGGMTKVFAPQQSGITAQIVRQAKSWRAQREPKIKYTIMSAEASAALKQQLEMDRADAGPKAPYDKLEYRGVQLQSRFSVVSEFETMKAVVDAMPDQVRLRISSIGCDSRACADYHVRIALGMTHTRLSEQIRECFRVATSGFNGVSVLHGESITSFDPEWPGDEELLN